MFKFLLILILVFLVIRMLSRIIFSSFVYNDNSRKESRSSGKEGSVTLENRPKQEKKFNKDEGEYVDYEEVK